MLAGILPPFCGVEDYFQRQTLRRQQIESSIAQAGSAPNFGKPFKYVGKRTAALKGRKLGVSVSIMLMQTRSRLKSNSKL